MSTAPLGADVHEGREATSLPPFRRSDDGGLPAALIARAWTDPAYRARLLAAAPDVTLPPSPFARIARTPESYNVDELHAEVHEAPPTLRSALVVRRAEVRLAQQPACSSPTDRWRRHLAGELDRIPHVIAAWVDALGGDERALPAEAVELAVESSRRRGDRNAAFADRVEALLPAVRDELAVVAGSTAPVAEAFPLGGDSHRGAEQVVGIELTDGRRAVLRPTRQWGLPALRVAAAIVAELAGVESRIPKTVSLRGDLELVEWIDHLPGPLGPAELAGFYGRLGALAAMAWLLGIGDLHAENLVAADGFPVAVDVEFVAQAFPTDGPLCLTGLVAPAVGRARPLSPLSVGTDPLVDGIGVRVEVDGLRRVLRWGIASGAPRHFVTGSDGVVAPPAEHAGALAAGFRAAATALANARRLADLADLMDGSRHQVRATSVYTAALVELEALSVLTRARRGADLATRLVRMGWGGCDRRRDVVACEVHDLTAGDVPYFVGCCRSGVVTHHSGLHIRLRGQTGVDSLRARVAALRVRTEPLAAELAAAARRQVATPPTAVSGACNAAASPTTTPV